MRYLVTGGCGFIGTNLIEYIFEIDPKAEVTIVDNLIVGERTNKHSKARLVVENIDDYSVAASVCKDMDVVIHLAAETGVIPSLENPKLNFRSNAVGVFNYLEASRINKVKKFVFASSGSVLGDRQPPVYEDMVPNPLSPYGASKLTGEGYCSAYYHSFGLETVILRFANVYGPHGLKKESLIHKFIKYAVDGKTFSIYGDGRQTRDLVYVKDLIRAIMKAALTEKKVGGEIFQVATGEAHSVLDVIDELQKLSITNVDKKTKVIFEEARAGEIINYYCSVDKINRVLGWKSNYKLSEGLVETVKWFKNNYGTD